MIRVVNHNDKVNTADVPATYNDDNGVLAVYVHIIQRSQANFIGFSS